MPDMMDREENDADLLALTLSALKSKTSCNGDDAT